MPICATRRVSRRSPGLVRGNKQFDRQATRIRDHRFGIRQSDERETQMNAAIRFSGIRLPGKR